MQNNVNIITKGATLNEAGVIYVLSRKVACEGPTHSLHPKVYLRISQTEKKEDSINCPYCKQQFIVKNGK
jgi:uncharacterized Zn-finger protein